MKTLILIIAIAMSLTISTANAQTTKSILWYMKEQLQKM